MVCMVSLSKLHECIIFDLCNIITNNESLGISESPTTTFTSISTNLCYGKHLTCALVVHLVRYHDHLWIGVLVGIF